MHLNLRIKIAETSENIAGLGMNKHFQKINDISPLFFKKRR